MSFQVYLYLPLLFHIKDYLSYLFKRPPHKMVVWVNCLSVFNHFVGLALNEILKEIGLVLFSLA